MQCTYKGNNEGRSRKLFCCGKAISVSYSECVSVVLDIQHAKRMRNIKNLLPFCLSHLFHTLSLAVLFSEKSSSFSILSDDRSKASSKTISPHSAI